MMEVQALDLRVEINTKRQRYCYREFLLQVVHCLVISAHIELIMLHILQVLSQVVVLRHLK